MYPIRNYEKAILNSALSLHSNVIFMKVDISCINKNMMISIDIITSLFQVKYGGHGYGHIPVTVKQQMLQKGISREKIDQIMIRNPARWLTWHN